MNTTSADASRAEQLARIWVMDLRRKSFVEIGGTARPRDIWQCVRERIELEAITAGGVPVTLSPDLVTAVRRKARDLAAICVAADSHAVI